MCVIYYSTHVILKNSCKGRRFTTFRNEAAEYSAHEIGLAVPDREAPHRNAIAEYNLFEKSRRNQTELYLECPTLINCFLIVLHSDLRGITLWE